MAATNATVAGFAAASPRQIRVCTARETSSRGRGRFVGVADRRADSRGVGPSGRTRPPQAGLTAIGAVDDESRRGGRVGRSTPGRDGRKGGAVGKLVNSRGDGTASRAR